MGSSEHFTTMPYTAFGVVRGSEREQNASITYLTEDNILQSPNMYISNSFQYGITNKQDSQF